MKTYDILNAGPKNRFSANGRIVSNSGRAIQLQNLVRNELSTLNEARELIKMGCFEMVASIYGNVPDVLSQLIRTMLIPKPGHEFIVADFSAIEARVLAWLAGEQWRLDAFTRGEDIYCASASAMFGVPVVKHGINGELRQKGKIAELACIAEGQLVLTDKGLVPIEKVTTEMKLWDGEEWISHDGVIFRGEREVITYDGLTATPDHLVFIEGKAGPIRFEFAASSSAHLTETGDGRKAIRLGENYKPRETLESSNKSVLCTDAMSRVRFNSMATVKQSCFRKVKRMSKLQSKTTYSAMVRSKINSSKTALRESERSGIFELRSKRNQIRVFKRDRSRSLFDSKIRHSEQRVRDRPHRQQRKLCSRQSPFCNKNRKLCQQADYCTKSIRFKILALCGNCSQKKIISGIEQKRNYSRCQNSGNRKKEKLARYTRAAKVYDIRNAGRHHRFTVSGKLVHNCGYQGGSGALTAMGALDMGLKEDDLPKLIEDWRKANPEIVQFWWDLEAAARETIKDHQDKRVGKIEFQFYENTLWLVLPSGRKLAYINPKLKPNKFGRMSLTYDGLNAANKWDSIETYGGKLAENCIAEGTLVMTNHGLVPIENITSDVLIWDGIEWVHHEGVIYKGLKEVIEVCCDNKKDNKNNSHCKNSTGIFMTPDHKILTEKGWRKCGESNGLDWAKVWLPDSHIVSSGSSKSWMAKGIAVRKTGCQKQVYDIRNCGSRHRFTVWDFGGECLRIVSNCTQGTARDLLAEAMWRMEQAGLDIVAHVHDEVVLEVPKGTVTVNDVCKIMNQNPAWAEGLPLASDGYSGNYYRKS